MGDRDPVRRAALALGHPVHHPAHQPGGELLGRPVAAGHHDRRRVADAALELADHPVRVGQRPALGRVPDQHATRPGPRNSTDGHGGAAAAQRDHLGLHPAAVRRAAHRGRGVRRAQVDPELVAHASIPPRPDRRTHPGRAGERPDPSWAPVLPASAASRAGSGPDAMMPPATVDLHTAPSGGRPARSVAGTGGWAIGAGRRADGDERRARRAGHPLIPRGHRPRSARRPNPGRSPMAGPPGRPNFVLNAGPTGKPPSNPDEWS